MMCPEPRAKAHRNQCCAERALRYARMLQCRGGKTLKIYEMLVEDRSNHVDTQLLVIVNGNVAETDHGLHAFRCLDVNQALLLQQAEGLATFLRQTEAIITTPEHAQTGAR